MLVETMEYVSFRDFLSWEVAYKKISIILRTKYYIQEMIQTPVQMNNCNRESPKVISI